MSAVLDRVATRLATALLPPGAVRERYRAEFAAELDALPVAGRLARSVSLALGAPALHRALVETGVLAFPHSPWWCRVQLHHRWQTRRTDDGHAFKRCTACGADDDGTYGVPSSDITGVVLRGPSQ